MTTAKLQTQLEQARSTVRRLQKTVSVPSGDVDADLDAEARLVASERLVERLERQLAESQSEEKRRQEENQKQAAQARQEEVRMLYHHKANELALAIDAEARELEPLAADVRNLLRELRGLSTEHGEMYRQVNGESIDEMQRLYCPGVIPPVFEHNIEGYQFSPLYGLLARFLYSYLQPDTALDTVQYQKAVQVDSALFRPKPTPKTVENGSLFARSRRGTLDSE